MSRNVAQVINFIYFCAMSRKIIAYKHYYEDFFNSLKDEATKEIEKAKKLKKQYFDEKE